MKIEDAANLLNISGEVTKKTIKAAYKIAASKYHPDKATGNTEMMKMINEAYEVLKNFEGVIEADNFEYPDLVQAAINEIIDLPNIIIEVVGNWVWVTGETKPHAKLLGKNGAGFFFAKKKIAWYFRPSDYKSKGRGKMTLDDIKDLHGSRTVKSKKQAKLAT